MMKREKTHYDLLNGSASAGIGFSAVIILYLLFTTIGSTIVGALGLTAENFYYNVITSIFPILAIAIVIGTFSIKRKENVLKTVNATKFNPLYIIPAILLAIGMLLGLGFILVGMIIIALPIDATFYRG